MVDRFRVTIEDVERTIEGALPKASG